MDEFELDLDKKEAALLESAFDKRRDGTVCYMDFCDRLEVRRTTQTEGLFYRRRQSLLSFSDLILVTRASRHRESFPYLRVHVSVQADGEGGGKKEKEGGEAADTMEYLMELLRRAGEKGIDLLECFEHFDANGDGSIDGEEFRQGLKKLDVRLSKDQAKEVMERFAGRRKGEARKKGKSKRGAMETWPQSRWWWEQRRYTRGAWMIGFRCVNVCLCGAVC